MTKKITGKTKLLGVIGHPVEHSLSPVMHNAALAQLVVPLRGSKLRVASRREVLVISPRETTSLVGVT